MKSKFRHFMSTWELYREMINTESYLGEELYEELEESLCAELFNTMGMLHELLRR